MRVMFTSSLLIGVLFFQIILAGDYSNLPDEISKQVAAQFLHKNKYSDSRCDSDQQYCESNIVSCMKHNDNLRKVLCAKNNSCPFGQICYLSNPCPANRSTGCTTNACYGQPCHNGGSCSMDSNIKGYSCQCQSIYDPATDCLTLKKELLITGCHVNICQNGGRCRKYIPLFRHTSLTECLCLPGFDGDSCENNINECQCVNGICTDDVNNCECHTGFTGVKCDTDLNATTSLLPPHMTTINSDNNTCRSFPCVHGNCTDHVNNYTCECHPGFTGVNCDTEIINCQNFPCVYGNCTDHVNNYICECHPGFTGVNCDTEISGCISSPCVHGTCQNNTTTYLCTCDSLYGGINCDEENASVVVPLVAVPVIASALGGLGFALWRKKIGKKNSTSPSPDDQERGQSEDSERNPDNVQSC